MGKLIDPERTRKARQAREERARKIRETAEIAFVRFPYSQVTLDSIGQQAGVKQGQANLAFRSREELFMTVIRAQLAAWYDALEEELTRLLGPLHMALELHEEGMEVFDHYRWQRQRLLEVATALAARVEDIHEWNAFDALYRGQMIAAAVHPVSRPVGNLAVDLMAEDHQVFALDLEEEVRRVVLDSLED